MEGEHQETDLLSEYNRLFVTFNDPSDAAKAHRKQILGTRVITVAPSEYWKLVARKELRISEIEWGQMTMSERGKCIAFVQVQAMVETVRLHKETIERNKQREYENAKRGK